MATPLGTLITTRADLADAFMEVDLVAEQNGFIWHKLFPAIDVNLQAGQHGIVPASELLAETDTLRGPDGGYARSKVAFDDFNWSTKDYGAEELIDRREERAYADWINAELMATQRAVYRIMLAAERRAKALAFNATTFAAQKTTLTNEWDDATNATPIDDIDLAGKTVWGRTGVWPDTLVVSRVVFRNLRKCEQVMDRIAASGAGDKIKAVDVTPQMLAAVFDLKQVLVGGGALNTANKAKTVTASSIWDDEYALLTKTAETEDIREVCLGRTYHWSEDGSQLFGLMEEYEEERTRTRVIRARHETDTKIVYPEVAQLFDNVTTA